MRNHHAPGGLVERVAVSVALVLLAALIWFARSQADGLPDLVGWVTVALTAWCAFMVWRS